MKLPAKKTGFSIALGGGGARGLAHIGVLKTLQREGVAVGSVTGTSMGAVVGAMFSLYADAVEVEEIFRKFLSSSFHEKYGKALFLLSEDPNALHEPDKTVTKLGKRFLYMKAASTRAVFSRNILNEAFRYLIPDVRFDDLEIPFACVSTDLRTGEEVVISQGRIIPAVISSSSIPGFVEPTRVAKRLLVDGSVVNEVPVSAARRTFGGSVIAVDVSMNLEHDGTLSTAFEIAMRGSEITGHYLTQFQLASADFVIHPAVGRTTWANFDRLDELIRAGETAARRLMPKLR